MITFELTLRHETKTKYNFYKHLQELTGFMKYECDDLLDKKYGKIGTRRRVVFEEQAQYYLSTLYRIFESGLGKQINLFIG